MDDIPGRLIGQVLGPEAFNLARTYFEGTSIVTELNENPSNQEVFVYPNPVSNQIMVHVNKPATSVSMQLIDVSGKLVKTENAVLSGNAQLIGMDVSKMNSGIYILRIVTEDWQQNLRVAVTH